MEARWRREGFYENKISSAALISQVELIQNLTIICFCRYLLVSLTIVHCNIFKPKTTKTFVIAGAEFVMKPFKYQQQLFGYTTFSMYSYSIQMHRALKFYNLGNRAVEDVHMTLNKIQNVCYGDLYKFAYRL